MHITWTTDIHLDCSSSEAKEHWLTEIRQDKGQALLITGDISDGHHVCTDLAWLATQYPNPIYFVLGNHDYYHRNFASVDEEISTLCKRHSNLIWLDLHGPVALSKTTQLIGHTGWGDAQNGDFLSTPIRINDHRLIEDLSNRPRTELQNILQQRGHQAAQYIEHTFQQALTYNPTTIIIATHVPPYPESAWYQEYAGAFDWIPDFTCKAVGDTILRLATENSTIQIQVYCGHGHSPGYVQMSSNLEVFTGKAEYGHPCIAGQILYA